MNILEKKQKIKSEIDRTNDEELLLAIARLLHIDDEVPDWHKQILSERLEEYHTGNLKMSDWEDMKSKREL